MGLIGKIRATGRVAEPPPQAPERVDGEAVARVSGSVQIRHVDAGSCNGCEIELGQAFSPVYGAERYGIRLVASPRQADALVVTGPGHPQHGRRAAQDVRRGAAAVPRRGAGGLRA